MHFRYELGFIPPAIDGKRHELKVELTKTGKKKYKAVRLKFRPEYMILSGPGDTATHSQGSIPSALFVMRSPSAISSF